MLALPYMKYERIKERTEQAYNTVVPTNYTNKNQTKYSFFTDGKVIKKSQPDITSTKHRHM